MLILDADAVREALPMNAAIAAMKTAFTALHEGRSQVPPRIHIPNGNDGVTLVMPARVSGRGHQSLATKVVSVVPSNASRGIPLIHAAVMVLDPVTGSIEAVLEGASLTAIRTAATSGLATDMLARKESARLAVIGAGVQARSHIEAVCAVRNIDTVSIYSRTGEKVDRLVTELSGNGHAAHIERAGSATEALGGADIICCTTNSTTPVFDDVDIRPGVHVNAVGSFTAGAREIPAATIARCRLFVDHRESALAEAGDIIQPLRDGTISETHIRADLGELLANTELGRRSYEQITVFKSVGIAVQDTVAAAVAVGNARASALGQEVRLGDQ